ncbi:MAG: nickel-type superoxide dismutase maturation protease [Proteobacteria bacterium]|nr:nickel-type superoxide dismutase maturation protease [Pseudomonadota bacterium]
MHVLRRSIRDFFLFLIGRRRRFVVAGNSMLPTLKNDESIFISPHHYKDNPILEGELVLVKHPNKDLLIVKRVAFIENQSIFLIGDNPKQSTDSRHFGAVSKDLILGKVCSKL